MSSSPRQPHSPSDPADPHNPAHKPADPHNPLPESKGDEHRHPQIMHKGHETPPNGLAPVYAPPAEPIRPGSPGSSGSLGSAREDQEGFHGNGDGGGKRSPSPPAILSLMKARGEAHKPDAHKAGEAAMDEEDPHKGVARKRSGEGQSEGEDQGEGEAVALKGEPEEEAAHNGPHKMDEEPGEAQYTGIKYEHKMEEEEHKPAQKSKTGAAGVEDRQDDAIPVEHFSIPPARPADWFKGPYFLKTHRWGHESPSAKMEVERIRCDDNKVVVATHSNTVEIFHLESGRWIDSLHGHLDWVWDFAFNDQHLVSASCDHTLMLWQLSTQVSNPSGFPNYMGGFDPFGYGYGHPYPQSSGSRQLQKYVGHEGWVQCVQFDERKIISGSGDQTLKIWDVETARCLSTLTGHLSFVYCLQYDQNTIVSGSGGVDKTLKLWDVRSSTCLATLEGHSATVMSLLFRENMLASGSFDKSIKLWDMRMRKCTNTLLGHSSAVGCVHFMSQTPKKLVSGSHDNTVKIWDTRLGTLEHTISAHTGVVVGVQMTNDGMVTCSVDRTVRRWKFGQ